MVNKPNNVSHLSQGSPKMPENQSGSPEDQAYEWLLYLYSGEATDEGRGEFSRWLDVADVNLRAYTAIEQDWRDLSMFGGEGLFQVLPSETGDKVTADKPEYSASQVVTLNKRRSRGDKAGSGKRLLAAISAVAASLVIAIGVWWLVPNSVTPTDYVTAVAEIKTFTLDDGSQLTLSGDSRLVMSITDKERHVELLKGNAYFEVVADVERVFRVRAAAGEIRVIGTAFDVKRGPGGVRVSVTEGAVEVASPGQVVKQLPVRLSAGQQASVAPDGRLSQPQSFDPQRLLAWREGRLIYLDARLDDVLAEINRFRQVKILLASADLGAIPVTMAIRVDETDKLLTGLEAVRPVIVKRLDNTILIQRKSFEW